jgi:glycine/D-amino acid oxidase-like deaminating enzyme
VASTADTGPEHVMVAVVGAGLGGTGVGIRLREAGLTDFVILERAVPSAGPGGTTPTRGALDVRPGAQRSWNDRVQQRMASSVWVTGGCQSWYLSAPGRNPTVWPGSTLAFRRATRRLDPAEYEIRAAGTAGSRP